MEYLGLKVSAVTFPSSGGAEKQQLVYCVRIVSAVYC
jgi:hypothetical protein